MNEINKSGIKAVGWTVLVKPAEKETKSQGGIILGSVTELEREQLAQVFGQVVDIGPIAFERECYGMGRVIARCALGDKVIFRRYAGEQFDGDDGIKYRLMNDQDIMAIKE